MRIRLSAFSERLRGSLFAVPMLFVGLGIVLGQLGLMFDRIIDSGTTSLPFALTSTVASARVVLSTIAAATITVAGIAFSVSLLTIQLASSQYSPRVVSGLFRDPFNKRVIGVVIGTFTYCLVVLRSVRSALDEEGQPVIPNISVLVAVILGITAILVIVAFINHNAHVMDISEILAIVTADTVEAVPHQWTNTHFAPSEHPAPEILPAGDGHRITFDCDGWIQLVDPEALLHTVPEGGTVRFDTAVGRYVIPGSPLCTIWPVPDDLEDAARTARSATHVGETRTLRQDARYGLRQLVDVALRALSPGVNDPTTAQDAIFHIGSVVKTFLTHPPADVDVGRDGRRLVLAQVKGHADLLALAYDEIRLAAAPHPTVCIYVLESIHLVGQSLADDVDPDVVARLHDHARLVVQECERSDHAPHDLERVRRVFTHHFGH